MYKIIPRIIYTLAMTHIILSLSGCGAGTSEGVPTEPNNGEQPDVSISQAEINSTLSGEAQSQTFTIEHDAQLFNFSVSLDGTAVDFVQPVIDDSPDDFIYTFEFTMRAPSDVGEGSFQDRIRMSTCYSEGCSPSDRLNTIFVTYNVMSENENESSRSLPVGNGSQQSSISKDEEQSIIVNMINCISDNYSNQTQTISFENNVIITGNVSHHFQLTDDTIGFTVYAEEEYTSPVCPSMSPELLTIGFYNEAQSSVTFHTYNAGIDVTVATVDASHLWIKTQSNLLKISKQSTNITRSFTHAIAATENDFLISTPENDELILLVNNQLIYTIDVSANAENYLEPQANNLSGVVPSGQILLATPTDNPNEWLITTAEQELILDTESNQWLIIN